MGWKLNLTGFTVVVFGIFMNYPPPPISPIVHQWKNLGNYFTFNDYNVYYVEDKGSGEGNVICLHGFPTSSFDYYKMLPHLRKRFAKVIFLDFLGFGFSDKPRYHAYSIIEQANLVEHLLTNVLSVKSVHVLAHDYGDTVAQELLARFNEGKSRIKIDSMCLMNGGIFPSLHRPRLFQNLLRMPILGTILSRFGNFYFFEKALTEVFGPSTQPTRADLNDFWTILRLKDGYRVLGALLGYIDDRFQHEERWVGALRESKVKLHMIYGNLDPVNPPPFATHYKNIINNPSIYVLDNISHYPQLEAPGKVAESYLSFLSNSKSKQI